MESGFLDETATHGTALSRNPNSIFGEVKMVRRQIAESAFPKAELHFTEWSSSYTPANPMHDSYHSAAYIIDKLKNCGDAAQSMSCWTFTVNVLEVNQAPQLAARANVSILAGRTLTITNTATDLDVPQQVLTFELVSGPVGMSINPANGLLSWRPLMAQAGTTNPVVVRVADNGVPMLTDTETFTAIALKPAAPQLTAPALNNGWFSFIVTGDQGPDYVIERSSVLTPGSWLPLSTNLAPVPPFLWSVQETNGTRNFYRARLMP